MRVRIPVVPNATVKKWNLKTGFVETSKFDHKAWFSTMDSLMLACELQSVHDDVDTLHGLTVSLLKKYEALADYLTTDPLNVDLTDDAWDEATNAVAFLVIQRYNREVSNGSWKHDG